ncbi:MAG: DNA repair protein RecO [Roseiflexaceae bacterium]|nr:DNA repair protein RecO [Roseiflexaceae bacterium]
MPRERVYRTEAVVLRRSDWSEADRLLTLLTPGGKRRVVAKGARKTISRLAGHIELFCYTTMLLAVGRTFDIVTQSAVRQSYERLRGDLQRISAAYYTAELIDRLIGEDDENPLTFELLVETLGALDSTRAIDLTLRYFELRLLGNIGYRPRLHNCANCQQTLGEDAKRFSTTAGGVLCPRCENADRRALPMSLGAFKLLRYLQTQSAQAVEQMTLSESLRHEVEQLLRAYLRQVLERDLKSVAFLDDVRTDPQGDHHGLH